MPCRLALLEDGEAFHRVEPCSLRPAMVDPQRYDPFRMASINRLNRHTNRPCRPPCTELYTDLTQSQHEQDHSF